MTVSTEINQAGYTGNGVTTVFPFTFRILQAGDLTVTVIAPDDQETVLILGTGYTIAGVGSYSGGAITLPQPLPTSYQIVLQRDMAIVQETDLRNQGTFFAEVHEDAFDYLTMLIQQVWGWFGLSLRRNTSLSNFYDAKGYRIANLADPTNDQDAVNNRSMRSYVEKMIAGVVGGYGWFIQAGFGAIYRTFQSKMRDVVSVVDFGAVGDGVTDDYQAFQNAHDSLPADGGVVIIPSGKFWRIEGIINITKPMTFKGSGSSPTTLSRTVNPSSTFFNVSNESCCIRDLRMIGIGSSLSTPGTFAIKTQNTGSRVKLINVQALNVYSGFDMKSNLFTIRDCEVRDIHSPSGVGIEVDQSSVVDGIGLITGTIVQNADDTEPYAGVNLKAAVGILMSDNQFVQCGHSVAIAPDLGKTVTSIKMINMYFDTSNDAGLLLSNASGGVIQRITVADSWLSSSKNGAGLRIVEGSNIDGLQLSSNEFYDSIYGIQIDNNCTIQNLDGNANVFAGNTIADISIGENVKNFKFTANRTGVSGGFTASPQGMFINPGCSDFTIVSNDFHKLVDNSYPASGVLISNNKGWGKGATTFDPASLTNGTGQTNTVACSGARMGDLVDISFSNALLGLQLTAWVSSPDIVSFRLQNGTGGTVDLGAGTIRVKISRVS